MDFLSVIPPIVAVALAIVTKRVLLSLFISIWVGGLIVTSGNPFAAVGVTFTWIKDVMIDPWNARFRYLFNSSCCVIWATGMRENTRILITGWHNWVFQWKIIE
ncbi:hypothetical protein GCM10007063_07400 [Lentibacillus kapialis]|uniref:Na+/H+ antiporter NhaC-like C-terminal domain-containing protein n=1 Tax=Lentibacillus kapialis TaxID=340214 RepID=A0A917PQ28_9BACI|nr:hypothetical protein [Lentibacillus kapialis]GGJ87469.1 hypothetical protein GCM10007063_07400 [Lentibacillus kapialis]